MQRSQILLSQIVTLVIAGWCLAADEVRYYEENGITYRETRQVVREPVTTPTPQLQAKAVDRPQWTTEQREFLRTCYVPTTRYVAETYWVGLWNPFDEPYLETRYRPVTCYQPQTQRVLMPVAVCRPVLGTQVADAGTANARSECKQTVSRVAVHGAPGGDALSSTQIAHRGEMQPADPVARMAVNPARPPLTTAMSNVVPPSNIPTPTYIRSMPAAPAPAYAPPGGYTMQPYVTAPTASPNPSANYAPPGGMSYGGQTVGGVSRLDKGPAPWGSR